MNRLKVDMAQCPSDNGEVDPLMAGYNFSWVPGVWMTMLKPLCAAFKGSPMPEVCTRQAPAEWNQAAPLMRHRTWLRSRPDDS